MHYYNFVFLLILSSLSIPIFGQTIVIEAETGNLTGLEISNSRNGYSGAGYITGFNTEGDQAIWILDISKPGYYQVDFTGWAGGHKEQFFFVNNEMVGKVVFEASAGFEKISYGKILLNQGTNTLKFSHDWGWVDLDKLTLTYAPIEPHTYHLTNSLRTPQPATNSEKLYAYLQSQWGLHTLSGQTFFWDELVDIAKKTPVIRSFDFQNYSNHNPWGQGSTVLEGWDDGTTQSILDWNDASKGCGITSIQWHWLSPTGGSLGQQTFYTKNTPFDVRQALIAGTPEHSATLRDIDTIANQLKRLDSANIPILWRPLHEAGGKWFWWGAHGAAPALALYDTLYHRLTNVHGLKNLIWVWSTPEEDWYPGNDKVDIFGYDSYPGDFNYTSQKIMFDKMWDITNGKRPLALSENGAIPDWTEAYAQDAKWLYFSGWNKRVTEQNNSSHIQSMYSNPHVLTQDNSCWSNEQAPVEIMDLKLPELKKSLKYLKQFKLNGQRIVQ